MKPKRNKMLSVRASEEEIIRVKQFAADLIQTNPYLTEADVIRELIGLENTGIITPEMRKRLRSTIPQTVKRNPALDDETIPTETIDPLTVVKAITRTAKKGGIK